MLPRTQDGEPGHPQAATSAQLGPGLTAGGGQATGAARVHSIGLHQGLWQPLPTGYVYIRLISSAFQPGPATLSLAAGGRV